MAYLIDTNIFIILLKQRDRGSWQLSERLAREQESEICCSVIVEAELWHGAEKYEVPDTRRAKFKAKPKVGGVRWTRSSGTSG